VGQDQDLDLSLMPRHKAAIDLGKPLIINQTNPETVMDGPEREALGLPSLQSAILAPMRLEQRVMGILSIGEMRNWERRTLGPQELLYAQIVSTLDALVYELAERGRQLRMERERFEQYESKAQLYHTYADLPRRLSSPISAILGAAEIIEGGSPNPPSELAKYNGIILKSVRAMMTEIRRFDELKNVLARNLV